MVMTERQVRAGAVDLTVAESGTGQRPFMLVHGFTGAKEDFTPWLERLAGLGWHAVAPDLRGHGGSSKPADESAYSFELMAGDVLALADALGWDTFVLLGHSMGGMVAQFVATAAPARLAGLVLMDTAHGPIGGLDGDMIRAAVALVREQGMDALADLLTRQESPLTTPARQRLLAGDDGYAAFEDRKFRATSAGLYTAMAPRFSTAADRLDSLRALSLPVLVIVGAEDAPFLGDSERMAAAIGQASLAVIPDAGHCPQFENPDAWWRALTAYLNTISL